MQILILGGSGFVGQRLARCLAATGLHPLSASRGLRPTAAHAASVARSPGQHLVLDACDEAGLTQALRGCDAVVNAVAGSPQAIAEGARVLAQALRAVGGRPLVHLSSMAVYGQQEGLLDETAWMPVGVGVTNPANPADPADYGARMTPMDPMAPMTRLARTPRTARTDPTSRELRLAPVVSAAGSAYARAKRVAEAHLAPLAGEGMPVAMLRPGCVWGPGSPLWVDRIAALLAAGRLGDLGARGDGWTHGLHVDDLCQAVLRLLLQANTGLRVYHLAAPDSPRWNIYLRDLAVAIGATPLRRLSAWQLTLDAGVLSPALYLAQRLGLRRSHLPPLPPGLLRLMASPMRLQCEAMQGALNLRWTPYERALGEAAAGWRRDNASHRALARNSGLPST
jgi:nucleoside-diphosphate-sugar epimerase